MRSSTWVVALAFAAAACGDTTTTTTTPSTSAPSLATSSTTAPVTTGPPTTLEPIRTACVDESATGPSFEFEDEGALDTFGLLSAKPSLQLTLRLGESPAAPDPQSVMVSTARIPGGILLSANPTTGEGALLTAIDADGDTRWTRCFADGFKMFVAPSPTATKALLLFYVPQLSVSEVAPDWRIIDLATGATVGSLAALFAEQGVDAEGIDGWMLAWSARSVLFGPAQDSAIDIARDRLIRVDFADFTATPIAFPASVAGQQPFEVQFGFTDADDVAVMAYEHGIATPTMLYINGAWTDDPTEFGMPPIRVGASMEDNGVSWLTGISRSGSEVWRVTDLPLIFGEGFRHATSDGVTVMAGCITFVDFECEQTLAGVDTATGSVLWTRDDYGGVLAIADGLALITPITPTGGTSSRILIDISTGEIADLSQRWSPNGYYQGCCGDESHWVQLSGGVLVANVDNVIEVWYPADVAPPTRTVSIP